MWLMKWRQLFQNDVLEAGQECYDQNAIKTYSDKDGIITAEVEDKSSGSDCYVEIEYNVTCKSMHCSCTESLNSNRCKHLVAALINYDKLREGENKVGILLNIECDDVINYAIQYNGVDIIRDVSIKNSTAADIEGIVLRIESDGNLLVPFEYNIEKINQGEELHVNNLKVKLNGDYLASLTERIKSVIHFSVYKGEEVLVAKDNEVTVLAFDEWAGLKYTPELLAAFSVPNHPVIASLILEASQYLQKWTGEPSLEGYQSRDPNRVKMMAAAAYAAIQKKNIVYANPPSSFELIGQRIRLADTVLEQHLGTCLDMTLLYVACLEAMGLNPFMVLMAGHIFAGVWLVDDSFSDTIMDDPSHIEKRMSNGINELLVVECTAMNAGKSCSFDEAVAVARQSVGNYPRFEFAVDVTRARSMGIIPLPVRIKTENGYVVKHEERKEKDITSAPEELGINFDLNGPEKAEKVDKLTQWERKLLDLSLRNMLINLRFTKAVVPVLCNDVGVLEDNLTEGDEFHVLPRPDNMGLKEDAALYVEALSDLGPFKDFIELESKHKKVHSLYSEKELSNCLTKMYRSAKTSMEENGASTLYLALGLLRWMEGEKVKTPRYAPIILVPIDIVRKSANKGYAMRMRDEDAQLNITLLEFLKQSFDIRVKGLDPLPTDEHGLDIPKIFAIIRHNILSMEMWDVVETAFIGNFSFSQFVMWNDIHNHGDLLEKNKVVRSLMKGAIDWDASINESDYTDEAYLPVTADSSQIRAINMAANNVSFVLHGPPGTGKSQTITAMIANALTKGKKVLFVAEKMAALEVVQKRLAALGIDDFCLELHSNKATKKAVLDQLRKNLEIGVWGGKTDYEQKIKDVRAMRADLDSYATKLHTKRAFGKSLKELIDIYETVPDYGTELNFSSEYAGKVTRADLDNHKRLLEQLVATGRGIGHPHNHPLSIVGQTVYTQTLKLEIDNTVTAYRDALLNMPAAAERLLMMLNFQVPENDSQWRGLCDISKAIKYANTIPKMFLTSENLDKDFSMPIEYLNEKSTFDKKKEGLLKNWREVFLGMNMMQYRTKYDEANKKLLGKGRALSTLVSEIQSFASFPVAAEQIPMILANIEQYQREEHAIKQKRDQIPYEWLQIIDSCQTVEGLNNYKQSVKDSIYAVKGYYQYIKQLDDALYLNDAATCADWVLNAYDALEEKEENVEKLLHVSFRNETGNLINDRVNQCNQILENASIIKDWIVYKQMETECRKAGLDVVCDAYVNGLEHEKVMSVYLRSIYKAIILSVIETEPALNSFTGNGFNEKVIQFKNLDAEFMELTKDEMYYKLTHNLPTDMQSVQISKELNILRRAISSNGRGLTIRSLFDQIPTILTKLCPCMLMSPISVAQYLSMNNDIFDIVIFDEASQLPTCKAVGVLARGKNAVIVGDPNQMPPTSFFAGNTIDEDNLDIEDLDSILDDCLALGMPSAHLQWHYRSKHESLIAFSNHEFYENSMMTFPSVNDLERKVSLVKIDGFFDRKKGRINEGEAKAIVEEIKRRYKDELLRDESVGVVTFNVNQQTLIEDMLQEEFQKDPEFDKWASGSEEALFVKNLENVQGDERDIILFSITYGPDETGKLSHNFGPLNKEGGWKRLNVAASRARMEMMVFSIMTSDMIDLRRTKAKGVESLKKFLEFAEKGELHLSYAETHTGKYQGILDRICVELDNAGYEYKKAVGHSKFKVDIAVVDPYNKDEFILGIMLDGESYSQSANTKDREVSQQAVLSGLGWKLHRMWTMDWWDNKQKEINNLMKILEERKQIAYEKAKESGLLDKLAKEQDAAEKEESEQKIETIEEAAVQSDPEEDAKPVVEAAEAVTADSDINNSENAVDPKTEPAEEKTELVSYADFNKESLVDISYTGPEEADYQKVAEKSAEMNPITEAVQKEYIIEPYVSADLEITPLPTAEFILRGNMPSVVERLQKVIDIEAPISYDRLVKKVLRSFDIARISTATQEFIEKALKKIVAKNNKQNGVKYYWRNDQNPDEYYIYRTETDISDKRSMDDISQQEIKNAVCRTLGLNGAMARDDLNRAAVKVMGFARISPAIVEAIDRGIKYGKKTGEITNDDKKRFILPSDVEE